MVTLISAMALPLNAASPTSADPSIHFGSGSGGGVGVDGDGVGVGVGVLVLGMGGFGLTG